MPDREKTITVLELMLAMGPTSFSETEKEAIRAAVELLKEQEVVRCKDCKHYNQDKKWCQHIMSANGDEWFCADGERKPTQTNAKNNALE